MKTHLRFDDPTLTERRCRSGLLLVLGLAVLATITPSTSARASDENEWKFDRRQTRHEHTAGQALSIENRYGDVRLRRTEESVFELSMLEQHIEGGPRRLGAEVEVEEGVTRVEITERWADGTSEEEKASAKKGRLELVVFVPPGAPVEVQTGEGLIEARKLRHDIEARSERGDIRLSTMGTVRARSEYGDLSVAYGELAWSPELAPKLVTKTGDIRVILPPTADVAIEVETHGRITTDYSIDIEREPGQTLKRATCRIGEGARRLRLESDRGAVEIFHDPGS